MQRTYTPYSSWPLCITLLVVLLLSGTLSHANAGQSARFGASVYRQPANEPWPAALARQDALFGPLPVVRIFFPESQGVPKPWSAPELNHTRAVVVSFKLLPQQVLAGMYDDALRHWFATAPRDRQVWWVYWHEPEDDIHAGRFTAEDYRAAFAHLDQLADEAANPMLRTTQVLMDWTLDPHAGRNWRDYYPGAAVIDVQAWDQYGYGNEATCTYQTMEAHEANRPAYQITSAEGNDYAIAEIGASSCIAQRPAWLKNIGDWARPRAVFVTYFHSTVGEDYRLTDSASQEAWRAVVNGSAFWGVPLLSVASPTHVTSTAATLACTVDPRELSTQFWFVSWRPAPGGARDWTAHPKVVLMGGPENRTLTLTDLIPNTIYRFVCKAQNNQTTQPVTSKLVEFRTAP